MIRKLRWKFIAVNLTTVMVMILVIFALIFHFTQESLERESLNMMESIGASPYQIFTPSDRREEINLPYFILQIDKLGNIVATGGGYYDLSDKDFLSEVLLAAMDGEGASGTIEKYKLRFLWVNSVGGLQVIFADTSSEEATLTNLVKTCIFVGVLSFFAFFALSFWLAKWAIQPVETAFAQQKQFLADASHELKTPLTVILTNAEMLQSPDNTPEDQRRFSESVLQMARQMRELVERLLILARMDNNASNMVMEPLDFSQLVEEELLPFEPVFFEQGLMLESNLQPSLMVLGSGPHLRQILGILLDNAMKYTEEGSVWVYLKRQGNQAILAVSNPGQPIKKEDLQNIFKRFYRVDKARTSSGGYGLGLPIAQTIAREHRGKLYAISDGGYNTFFLELPLATGKNQEPGGKNKIENG